MNAVKADLKTVQDAARAAIPEAWLQLPRSNFLTTEQTKEAAQQAVDDEPLAPFLPPPELDMDYRPEGDGHELVLQVKTSQLSLKSCCISNHPCIWPSRVHLTSIPTRT